jgi:hypothetical protein
MRNCAPLFGVAETDATRLRVNPWPRQGHRFHAAKSGQQQQADGGECDGVFFRRFQVGVEGSNPFAPPLKPKQFPGLSARERIPRERFDTARNAKTPLRSKHMAHLAQLLGTSPEAGLGLYVARSRSVVIVV